MSFWKIPKIPMNNAVIAPMIMMNDNAASDNSKIGDKRETMKRPAVTIVAAWINAEIGVGPSIESGNQTCNGTCADLPIAPMNKKIAANVNTFHSVPKKLHVCDNKPGFALTELKISS